MLLTRGQVATEQLLPGVSLAVKEVNDVHPQSMSDEQQVRVLRIPHRALVALDAATVHAGEMPQLLLR